MNGSSAPHHRSPISGPSPSNLGIEIDSPRLTYARALLVLTRSCCFRARSRAMPPPACCCSPQATRTRLCAAPPSASTPPGPAEPSHGRLVVDHSPERRRTPPPPPPRCCSRRQPSPGHPSSNRAHLQLALIPFMLPHPSLAAGMASPCQNRAP